MKLIKSSADSHVTEIRAKMASAEIKARQLELEEERRTKEFAKQLETQDRKIEEAGYVVQKIELEAKERTKTQEAKDEAARLAVEAENLKRYETLFITMTLSLYPIVSVILMMIR